MKAPDLFKPENRDAELKSWGDWKFSFVNYIKGVDPSMAQNMDMVEKNVSDTYDMESMTDENKGKSVRLYSLLTSYLRLRPLKLIRHIKNENGFAAWQVLLKEMQPATRARSLALLSQLSRIQFEEKKTVSEQLPQFEALVQEYERISGQNYSDDAKVAAVLLACPMTIRQHLHLWLTDTTTYEQLKDRILQLEAVTTRWDASNNLMLPTRASNDDATPMEVDYVGKAYDKGKKGGKKGKDKGKAKGKDKGKPREGKGLWKSSEKGRSMWEKGPGKKGKSPSPKGGKSGACHVCGKMGHLAKDCWKRVNQIEEQQTANPGGSSSSSTGQTGSVSSTQYASVRMVRLEPTPEEEAWEVFDLTTMPQEEAINSAPWHVRMVRVEEDAEVFYELEEEEYKDCHEPVVIVPEDVAIVAMNLQDDELEVNMVKVEECDAEDTCLVTLDSGADISVLPREFAGVGTNMVSNGELKMVEAQGRRIAYDGLARAKVRIKDRSGKMVEIVEEFVLGNVHHPILCAGRLLKRGWSLGGVEGQLHLKHDERRIEVPLNTQRGIHFSLKHGSRQ